MKPKIIYRLEVIENFRRQVQMSEHPDSPVLIAGDLEMSLADYLEQIENRTPLGIILYQALEREYDIN